MGQEVMGHGNGSCFVVEHPSNTTTRFHTNSKLEIIMFLCEGST